MDPRKVRGTYQTMIEDFPEDPTQFSPEHLNLLLRDGGFAPPNPGAEISAVVSEPLAAESAFLREPRPVACDLESKRHRPSRPPSNQGPHTRPGRTSGWRDVKCVVPRIRILFSSSAPDYYPGTDLSGEFRGEQQSSFDSG